MHSSTSAKAPKVARRGSGRPPRIARAIRGTSGPETRTTPIPPRPAGVAIAAIVSRATSSLGMRRLVAVEHSLDLPLLRDREDVVHEPVEHQPRREKEEEDAEYERHELHHLGLHRIRRYRGSPGLHKQREGHQD